MIPHERSLVEKFANKPFALVGVNGDPDREPLLAFQKKTGINWRSFFQDGGQGPISRQFQVVGWPTIFVLDGEGRIRVINVRGARLEKAVESLLEEME